MLFNSFGFVLLFLPLFFVAFYLAKRIEIKWNRLRGMRKLVVIAFSLVFYVPFGLKNCLVLAGSLLVNSIVSLCISRRRSGDGNLILCAGVLLNVGFLLLFKFSGLFFPVAISFYTFNQISYIVDLYKGDIERFEFLNYLAYVLFFPKILQGPLMGYGDFVKELDKSVSSYDTIVDYEAILRGLFLLSIGLFKKVILADTFGRAVDFGYDNLMGLGSLEAILVAVFYSFQLYFDFSGYCDVASAICMMLGMELPVNFNSPYKAVNIVDFWKRWHITLTKFFTKYVYIPLGGNRKGAVRMYVNFMIVFLLSGLWHGNGWNFIVWGAMHGVLYVITRIVKGNRSAGLAKKGLLDITGHAVKVILTFTYVTVAWVFFRAKTVTDAFTLLARVFTGGSKRVATGISACFQLDEIWYVLKVTPLMKLNYVWELCMWLFLILSAVIIFFTPNALEISKKCKVGVKTTLVTAFFLVWSIVSFAGVSTFLYMNF